MSQPATQPVPGPSGGAPAPVALTYRFVADARAASRVARALSRASARSRSMLILYGFAVCLGAFAYWVALPVGVAMTVYVAVVVLALPLLTRVRVRRALRGSLAPGSEHWSGFGPTSFATRGPIGATEYSYAALRDVRQADGAVLFRLRANRMLYALPQELVPPHELARLQSLIAAAGADARA